MKICQINVLNRKHNKIKVANVSKLYKYCKKFDRSHWIKIFYMLKDATWSNTVTSEKLFTSRMNKVNLINLAQKNVFEIIENAWIKAKKNIIYGH